jgi:hypothetical protein
MTRSASSINNSPVKTGTDITANNMNNNNSNSVVHLVHNMNNKNDNTLKKRNALVAYEFKTLLDRVVSPDGSSNCNSPHHHNNKSNDAFTYANGSANNSPPAVPMLMQHHATTAASQPQKVNNHHHHSHHKRNHSPQSLSSTSSTCSTASSSPSTSSSKKLDSIRGLSPSQLTGHVKFANGHHDYDNSNLYKVTHQGSNLKSKSQILTNGSSARPIVVSQGMVRFEVKNSVPTVTTESNTNNVNTTIWREELNAKSNVQEQIKKQVWLDAIILN